MRTLSQEVNASGTRPTEGFPARHSTILRFSSALIFTAALALAPAPTFAQHGGGGGGAGGGGGSHGGGGGGGGHASGGSGGSGSHAGGTSAPSGGGGSRASGTSAGGSNNNSGGHWWNPFHSGSSGNGNGTNAGNVKSGSNQSSEHYAAGNNTWQDPPATAGHASGHVNYYAPATGARTTGPQRNPTNGAIASTRGAVAGPPHVFPPRHPGGPYYPYYPYYFYPYYGFGWGGGLWWGGFGPCDPFWGCYGYGYGYSGGGYGYYGGTFGGNYSADLSYDSPSDASQEPNPSLYAAPSSNAGQSSGETSSQQPYVILYLKDGSSYAVSDYWLFGGKLHYITSYGGENLIDQSQLDLQRTVNENAARGVDFTLRPEPAGNGDTAPAAPAPDTNPPPPQQ